jgi:hypothetical protein
MYASESGDGQFEKGSVLQWISANSRPSQPPSRSRRAAPRAPAAEPRNVSTGEKLKRF